MAEQRIFVRARVPHPPERVFERLVDHEALPEWLGVDRVTLRRRGERGGLGTVRRVHVRLPGGLTGRVDERVLRCDAPRHLQYRAESSLVFRSYEGDIRLPPAPDGCFVEWTVRLRAWLPLSQRWTALQVERALRDGLRRLEARLGPGPGQPRELTLYRAGGALLGAQHGCEERGYAELLRAAEEAQAQQYARALALGASGSVQDTRYWLLLTLALATAHTLDRVQAGTFQDPCWVLRVVLAAHRYLEDNLSAADDPQREAESHWQSWLRATANARRWWSTEVRGAAHSVAKGTHAHFLEDYPRALAEVYARHYRSLGVDWESFHADWRSMLPAYDQAWALVRPELELMLQEAEPLVGRLATARAPELLLQEPMVGVQMQRERAWERGRRLLTLLRSLED